MRYLAVVGGLVLLILLLGASCDDPQPGDPCRPGSSYVHVTDTRRVSLHCNEDGYWERS